MSPDPTDFARQVQGALAHLYDPVALRTHPFAQQLIREDPRLSAVHAGLALRQRLLDGIATLRPDIRAGETSPAWRGYRLLELRYIEALTPSQAQGQLGISKAQYYRDHARAVEALVSTLGEQWRLGVDNQTRVVQSPNVLEEQAVPTITHEATDRLTSFLQHARRTYTFLISRPGAYLSRPHAVRAVLASVLTGLTAVLAIGGVMYGSVPDRAVLWIRSEIAAADSLPVLTVFGDGESTAPPDMAFASFDLQVDAASPTQATNQVAANVGAVIHALKSVGIADSDIRISDVSLSASTVPLPQALNGQGGPPLLPNTQFRATNTLVVSIENLARLSEVLAAAAGAGAIANGSPRFVVKDDTPLRAAALDEARRVARAKAEAFASSVGWRITGIQSMVEENPGEFKSPTQRVRVRAHFTYSST